MITVIKNAYLGGIKERKREKFLKRIEDMKITKGLFLVTLPLGDEGLLEIYSFNQFKQPYYKTYDSEITVVGVAKGKGKADGIVVDIIQDALDAGFGTDVKAYLGLEDA